MVELSVIIVNWNAKDYLLRCLKSLLPETRRYETEIFVVDNASTDGSPEAVEECFPHIKIIRNTENLGFAKANNAGLRQSTGKYICLINSDVELLQGPMDRMIAYMNMNPKIGILGPKILNPDLTLQPSCRGFPTIWNSLCRALALDSICPMSKLFGGLNMTWWQHDSVRSVPVLSGCFWMVRRKAINDVGLLDERFFLYAEDKDWCKRFWDSRWEVVYFPEARVVHYGGASSSAAPVKFYIEMQRSNIQYWKKHYNRLSHMIFYLILLLHQTTRVFYGMSAYFTKYSDRKNITPKINTSVACLKWLLNISKPPLL